MQQSVDHKACFGAENSCKHSQRTESPPRQKKETDRIEQIPSRVADKPFSLVGSFIAGQCFCHSNDHPKAAKANSSSQHCGNSIVDPMIRPDQSCQGSADQAEDDSPETGGFPDWFYCRIHFFIFLNSRTKLPITAYSVRTIRKTGLSPVQLSRSQPIQIQNSRLTRRNPENFKGSIYFVPKILSPASPRPGTIYPFSFRQSSNAAR